MTTLTRDRQQAARKADAERFTAIAAKHAPPRWQIIYRDDRSLNGYTYPIDFKIVAPSPVTRRRLYVFLHECGHAWLDHHEYGRKKPMYLQEFEAEQWAMRVMREEGVPVPRASTRRAKSYVAWKIRIAVARGAKRIDRKAARFAGFKTTDFKTVKQTVAKERDLGVDGSITS